MKNKNSILSLPLKKEFYISILYSKNFLYVLCIITWIAYFLPYFIFGENSTLLIHDNLDSNVIWTRILNNSGKFFASPSTPIEQVFNGIPRNSLYANYDISLIWFKIFGTFYGYVFNKILMSLIGFFGMYLLLKRHFISDSNSSFITIGIPLIYSLLPYWSFTPSVSGLPFILYAFLNFRNRRNKWSNWIILVLFPFYSSLVLSGFFIVFVLILILIYDTIIKRNFNFLYFYALLILCILYLISHFPALHSHLFNSNYSTIRSDFKSHTNSIGYALSKVWKIFFEGRYDAESLHKYMLIVISINIFFMFYQHKFNRVFIYIFIFIVITSLFYGLHEWSKYAPINDKIMNLIPIKLKRFHWLHPMLWYILIAISLNNIQKLMWFGNHLVKLSILIQLLVVIKHHELIVNKSYPTFKEFYAETQFKQIKDYIGKPLNSYRVVSIGIHPAISQYNGFYTLDGYFVDYPRDYKLKFREVIINELERDKSLKDAYDNWGSRCYAFSSEIGQKDLYVFEKNRKYNIEKLDFNFLKLKKLGGEYILSKALINTKNNPDIRLLKSFNAINSIWAIHLYHIL